MAGSAVKNAKLHGELRGTLAPVRVADRAAAGDHLSWTISKPERANSSAPRSRSCSGSLRRSGSRAPTPGSRPFIPTIANALVEGYAAAQEAQQPFRDEYRVVSPDGVVRWVVDQTVILPGGDGHPALTQGVIFDITDSKRRRARPDPSRQSRSPDGPAEPRPVPKPARRRAHARRQAAAARWPSSTSTSTTSSSSTTASATRLATSCSPPSPDACEAPPGSDDIVGRDGGDEFLLLMGDLPG